MAGWIPTNKFIGSCPYCGGRVFENDFIRYEFFPAISAEKGKENLDAEVFRCLHCKNEIQKDNLIPF